MHPTLSHALLSFLREFALLRGVFRGRSELQMRLVRTWLLRLGEPTDQAESY